VPAASNADAVSRAASLVDLQLSGNENIANKMGRPSDHVRPSIGKQQKKAHGSKYDFIARVLHLRRHKAKVLSLGRMLPYPIFHHQVRSAG